MQRSARFLLTTVLVAGAAACDASLLAPPGSDDGLNGLAVKGKTPQVMVSLPPGLTAALLDPTAIAAIDATPETAGFGEAIRFVVKTQSGKYDTVVVTHSATVGTFKSVLLDGVNRTPSGLKLYKPDTVDWIVPRQTAGDRIGIYFSVTDDKGRESKGFRVVEFTATGAKVLPVGTVDPATVPPSPPAPPVMTVFAGSSDGTGTFRENTRFAEPGGVCVDASGNVYVADTGNHCIRKITPAGVMTTLAGNGERGMANGTGEAARFDMPSDLAIAADGKLYVADTGNDLIRMIDTKLAASNANFVTTYAGGGRSTTVRGESWGDGVGAAANFGGPRGVAVDGSGNVFVADTDNHMLRKIDRNRQVTTLSGYIPTLDGTQMFITGWDQDLQHDFVDGPADRDTAQLFAPQKLAVAPDGRVFIADEGNNAIRIATQQQGQWSLSTYATVTDVIGLTLDSDRQPIVTSALLGKVLKLRPNGTTIDMAGGSSAFKGPRGVARAADGTLYVADTLNHCVRKIK